MADREGRGREKTFDKKKGFGGKAQRSLEKSSDAGGGFLQQITAAVRLRREALETNGVGGDNGRKSHGRAEFF